MGLSFMRFIVINIKLYHILHKDNAETDNNKIKSKNFVNKWLK